MSAQAPSVGSLYVVATPIGNLSDFTPRAREVLSSVAVVAAEDTRHTGTLLRHFGIDVTLVSLHEHNEPARAVTLVERMRSGESVAIVSDAGTPLISDPGFELVRSAIASGIRVIPIPGACAAVAALSVAGLPTDRFSFEGFLPAKPAQRRERLTDASVDERTLVFYEAPHRIKETLADLARAFGERRVVVARELTKQFETIYRGTASELSELAECDADMNRGEIVIVVAGAEKRPRSAFATDDVLRILISELSPAQAAKLAARITGGKRDEIYRRAIELNSQKA